VEIPECVSRREPGADWSRAAAFGTRHVRASAGARSKQHARRPQMSRLGRPVPRRHLSSPSRSPGCARIRRARALTSGHDPLVLSSELYPSRDRSGEMFAARPSKNLVKIGYVPSSTSCCRAGPRSGLRRPDTERLCRRRLRERAPAAAGGARADTGTTPAATPGSRHAAAPPARRETWRDPE
jgi:hypothetical protein